MNRHIVACFLGFILIAGCATLPKRVIRDRDTYIVEILAGLQREQEAATALLSAADAARGLGDEIACRVYAQPALLIQAKAQPQAYRALFLAGLPYPNPDGSLPDPKDTQPDPGPAPKLGEDAAVSHCLVDTPEVDPPGLEVLPAPPHGGDNE